MSFSGKVVLVTGASSGIGAAAAVLFASEGARVAFVARNETKLSSVAQQCAASGNQPLIIKVDVANEEEAKTIVQRTVDHFGKLDILVNNGISRFALISDPNILETFDIVMKTNLRSIVQLTSLAAPHLAATKGNIVNVSSIAGFTVLSANSTSYCVAKAGLNHFTRCAALELSASGVRVNSISPGPVRTNILETSGLTADVIDEAWDNMKGLTTLNHVSEPEEMADLIAFLASNKSRSITGSVYLSDSGFLLKK